MFFFNVTATTEIYTLSLHDALPICQFGVELEWLLKQPDDRPRPDCAYLRWRPLRSIESRPRSADRKSTRLNSSHLGISYAVFCLKKKIQYNIYYRNLTKCTEY